MGYQVDDRVSVRGTTGYGTGALSLTPDGASALETGVSMMMSAVETRGELVGSRATGGFALAFKADELWAGAASELLDGPTRRLKVSEAEVTRVRTALEGSRGLHARRRSPVADAERRGGSAPRRRRRGDGRGHGRRRRPRLHRHGDGAVSGTCGCRPVVH